MILCSPTRRTLQTAKNAFLFDKNSEIWVLPDLRDGPASDESPGLRQVDRGQDPHIGDPAFRDMPVLHHSQHSGWGKDAQALASVKKRADSFRYSLHELAKVLLNGGQWRRHNFKKTPIPVGANRHVAIVSHNSFLNYLTQRDKLSGEFRLLCQNLHSLSQL